MISACLFDIDGIIVDSVYAHFISMKLMFEKYGFYSYTEKLDISMGAVSSKKKIKRIETLFNIKFENIDDMCIDKYKFLDFNLINYNQNFAAIVKFLEEKDIKIAYVTNARHEYVEHILTDLNIDFKNSIIASNSLNLKQKPEPDLYLWAINKLKVTPIDCLIFEDSEIGILSAQKTGSRVIKINNYLELTKEYIRKILNDSENERSYSDGGEWK